MTRTMLRMILDTSLFFQPPLRYYHLSDTLIIRDEEIESWWTCRHLRSYPGREHTVFILIFSLMVMLMMMLIMMM